MRERKRGREQGRGDEGEKAGESEGGVMREKKREGRDEEKKRERIQWALIQTHTVDTHINAKNVEKTHTLCISYWLSGIVPLATFSPKSTR